MTDRLNQQTMDAIDELENNGGETFYTYRGMVKKYYDFLYFDPIPQLVECGLLAYEDEVTDHSMKLVFDTVDKFFEQHTITSPVEIVDEIVVSDGIADMVLEFCGDPSYIIPPDEFILTDKILIKSEDIDKTTYATFVSLYLDSHMPITNSTIPNDYFIKIFESENYLNQFRKHIWHSLLYYFLKERFREMNLIRNLIGSMR